MPNSVPWQSLTQNGIETRTQSNWGETLLSLYIAFLFSSVLEGGWGREEVMASGKEGEKKVLFAAVICRSTYLWLKSRQLCDSK